MRRPVPAASPAPDMEIARLHEILSRLYDGDGEVYVEAALGHIEGTPLIITGDEFVALRRDRLVFEAMLRTGLVWGCALGREAWNAARPKAVS